MAAAFYIGNLCGRHFLRKALLWIALILPAGTAFSATAQMSPSRTSTPGSSGWYRLGYTEGVIQTEAECREQLERARFFLGRENQALIKEINEIKQKLNRKESSK